MGVRLYQIESLPPEPRPILSKIGEALDDRTIAIRFQTPEKRRQWKELAAQLGHDEHALAQRLLTDFIGYIREPEI